MSEVTAICKTAEEELAMTMIVIYCQAAYRKMKQAKKPITIQKIIDEALKDLRRRGANIPTTKLTRILLEKI